MKTTDNMKNNLQKRRSELSRQVTQQEELIITLSRGKTKAAHCASLATTNRKNECVQTKDSLLTPLNPTTKNTHNVHFTVFLIIFNWLISTLHAFATCLLNPSPPPALLNVFIPNKEHTTSAQVQQCRCAVLLLLFFVRF